MKKFFIIILFTLCASPAFAQPVTATWVDKSDNEQGFVMQRTCYALGETTYTQSYTDLTPLIPANQTTQVFQHPAQSTCKWRIFAYNQVGRSDPSNEVETTTMTVPAAPGTLNLSGVPVTSASEAVLAAGEWITALQQHANAAGNNKAKNQATTALARNDSTLKAVLNAERSLGE